MIKYPPYIDGALPAFEKGKTIAIPFTPNPTVSSFNSMVLRIKSLQTNNVVCDLPTQNVKDNIAYFNNYTTSLKEGQFYKVQLAYDSLAPTDANPDYGYLSTVGIIKCCYPVEISVQGLNKYDLNLTQASYIGEMKTLDPTEIIDKYYFNIYNSQGELIKTTGELQHNNDTNVKYNSENESYIYTDSWSDNQEIFSNKANFIEYGIITNNGLRKITPRYPLGSTPEISPSFNLKIKATSDRDEGRIKLWFDGSDKNLSIKMLFQVYRASSKDNFQSWHNIIKDQFLYENAADWEFYDYLVEQGVEYRYGWRQYNDYGVQSSLLIMPEEETVSCDFEDMFLYDGERQLKIKFNPKISSFKTTLLEQKTDTIGGRFPIFFRNGNTAYKEFPISGLVSYLMDENCLFSGTKEKENKRTETKSKSLKNIFGFKTNLTGDNFTKERDFKLEVLNWLNNGQVKVFKSSSEGNYIVRLMNVSLSPQDTLSRMLHTFQANAYEVAEYTVENLFKQNFIDITYSAELETVWHYDFAQNIMTGENQSKDILSGYTVYEVLKPGEATGVQRFRAKNWPPRTLVRYSDKETGTGSYKSIMIGITGEYEINEDIDQILKLQIAIANDESHLVNLRTSTVEYSSLSLVHSQGFDKIMSVEKKFVPKVQLWAYPNPMTTALWVHQLYQQKKESDKDFSFKNLDLNTNVNDILYFDEQYWLDKGMNAEAVAAQKEAYLNNLFFSKGDGEMTNLLLLPVKTTNSYNIVDYFGGSNVKFFNVTFSKLPEYFFEDAEEANYSIELYSNGKLIETIVLSDANPTFYIRDEIEYEKILIGNGIMFEGGCTYIVKTLEVSPGALDVGTLDSIVLE